MTETQKTQGTVKAVRRDGKALTIDGDTWYSSFNAVGCNKGDQIELEFVINEKDGRTYHNIKSIKIVKQMISQQAEAREVKATTMREAYVKDIFVALMVKAEAETQPLEVAKLAVDVFRVLYFGVKDLENEVSEKDEKSI